MTYVLRFRLSGLDAEVEVPFKDLEELRQKLNSVDLTELSSLVGGTSGLAVAGEHRAPRPELEGICSVGPGGLPLFSRIPESKGEYVGLALFAVEPRALEGREVEKITGVDRVASHYFSAPGLKSYFVKDNAGKFTLSAEGKRWITGAVLPALRGS